jgi:fructose-1,6-bisphosphatase/inositol monophosphatase family enzyme
MRTPYNTELEAAVLIAGGIINKTFSMPQLVTDKDDGTPVTAVDHAVNAFFREFADKYQIGFIGEEGNGDTDDNWVLYVDPLDGTGAYARGIATATIAVSLMHCGEPLIAVIHNPITGQTWSAEYTICTEYCRHGSAKTVSYVDAKPQKKFRTAICAWPGVDQRFADFQKKVLENPDFSDQQMGAFAIGGGLIASGLLHATAISAGSAVETAAMSLIVREAGGVAIDLLGNPLDSFELGQHKGKSDFLLPNGAIIACNMEVAEALLRLY